VYAAAVWLHPRQSWDYIEDLIESCGTLDSCCRGVERSLREICLDFMDGRLVRVCGNLMDSIFCD
jgi:hypothetical protein